MRKLRGCEDCKLSHAKYAMPNDLPSEIAAKRWCGGLDPRWCISCALKHPGSVNIDTECEDCGRVGPRFGMPTDRLTRRRWCRECASRHPSSVDITNKKCEDCGQRQRSFGIQGEPRARWCNVCVKNHPGASVVRTCEDCGRKGPSFRLPGERRKRWCARCAKSKPGAVDVDRKTCEDCTQKRSSFGMPSEGRARWCGTCAKAHPGAADVANKKCEDCRLKRPSFGMPDRKRARWCAGCSKEHVGAVDVVSKRCEDCAQTRSYFGLLAEGKRRWCALCAVTHDGAVNMNARRYGAKPAAAKAMEKEATVLLAFAGMASSQNGQASSQSGQGVKRARDPAVEVPARAWSAPPLAPRARAAPQTLAEMTTHHLQQQVQMQAKSAQMQAGVQHAQAQVLAAVQAHAAAQAHVHGTPRLQTHSNESTRPRVYYSAPTSLTKGLQGLVRPHAPTAALTRAQPPPLAPQYLMMQHAPVHAVSAPQQYQHARAMKPMYQPAPATTLVQPVVPPVQLLQHYSGALLAQYQAGHYLSVDPHQPEYQTYPVHANGVRAHSVVYQPEVVHQASHA